MHFMNTNYNNITANKSNLSEFRGDLLDKMSSDGDEVVYRASP